MDALLLLLLLEVEPWVESDASVHGEEPFKSFVGGDCVSPHVAEFSLSLEFCLLRLLLPALLLSLFSNMAVVAVVVVGVV